MRGCKEMAVKIQRDVLDAIAAHARDNAPHEACGILLADPTDPRIVSAVLPAENVETTAPRHRYLLGHREHLRAVEMEAAGEAAIVGYYHSHPAGDAQPSPRDAEQAVPDVTYLIVGLRNGWIHHAVWRFAGDSFVQEPLEVGE